MTAAAAIAETTTAPVGDRIVFDEQHRCRRCNAYVSSVAVIYYVNIFGEVFDQDLDTAVDGLIAGLGQALEAPSSACLFSHVTPCGIMEAVWMGSRGPERD